ncbi:hypothetical protein SAY86_006249 [Trapa natans]|uniref:DUF1421 domain-containing protein n=1 Tax=Trapa natans TaxID=22666 RepID=A0AAN7L489_TRANT|nr:hypothetical protein SAY86_006249 [Trapa natans]
MNTSQYMDKRIMDLASSTNVQTQNKDFIDLMKHPEEERHSGRSDDCGGNGIDGLKVEEIVPSYDFQPIRPTSTVLSSPKSFSFDGGSSSRAWGSLDSKTNSSIPIQNYSSLDPFEPVKVIPDKDQHARSASIVTEVDQTIKEHIENVLHVLDGISARLTQLESRTRKLENSVDDLKVTAGNNYGNTEGKMKQLENLLREVHNGVEVIKDKQETIEGKLQLAKLQMSKPDHHPQQTHNTANVDSMQPPQPSLPQQPHVPQHAPPPSSAPFQQSGPHLPHSMTPLLPHQIVLPSVPMSNQFPHPPNPSIPQQEPYLPPPPPNQPQEAPNQQYQLSHAAQKNQQYLPPQQPPYSQPEHQPQQPAQHQLSLGQHSEEPPYIQYPPPGFRQPPPPQPPQSGIPPSQQLYGPPSQMYKPPPPGRLNLGFSSDPYPYSLPSAQYGSNSPMKLPHQHSQSGGGGGYPQLPTARVLPQALPTASGINSGPGSNGTGNRPPVDDVVEKVASMGFPRDQVKATVRKLTHDGQSVDLNMVLDKLMNDSSVQPPRGWFGR